MKVFKSFRKCESGATAIEYGLIAGLIAVVIITGATLTGTSLDSQFSTISSSLTPAPTTPPSE